MQVAVAGFPAMGIDADTVLTGSAPTLAPCLAVGCVGAVLAFANAAPYATVSIYEAHRTREAAAALDWQNRIARAAQLVTVKYGVPGLKYAMDLNGYYGGIPRLPLTVLKPDQQREVGGLRATVHPGNIENPLRVFKERVHLILLSARLTTV